MTGQAPRHDHQDVDQWAQQGLVNSAGRTSPESEVPEVPDEAGPDTAAATGNPVAQDPVTAEPGWDGGAAAARAPGTVTGPGDVAETAAFEGEGAYSEGRHASGPPAS